MPGQLDVIVDTHFSATGLRMANVAWHVRSRSQFEFWHKSPLTIQYLTSDPCSHLSVNIQCSR
jgi:hypothetical protein